MGREVVFITADSGGWTLVHNDKRIGPYPTEKDALSVAQLWAEGARRQGIMLEFVVEDSETPARGLVESPTDHGQSTDENTRA